jgi:hypothetical protein
MGKAALEAAHMRHGSLRAPLVDMLAGLAKQERPPGKNQVVVVKLEWIEACCRGYLLEMFVKVYIQQTLCRRPNKKSLIRVLNATRRASFHALVSLFSEIIPGRSPVKGYFYF